MPPAPRSKDADARRVESRRPSRETYFDRAAGPLHSLIFLLPLVVMYEIGAVVFLSGGTDGQAKTVEAHSILVAVFSAFGPVGGRIPAIALVVTLIALHLASRQRTRLRPAVLSGMAVESVAFTLPLLVLSAVIGRLAAAQMGLIPAAQAAPSAGSVDLTSLSPGAGLTVSLGAGLYEEFLFRLVLVSALARLLRDLVGLSAPRSAAAAVLLAAIAFAWYHEPAVAGGDTVRWDYFAFYTLAGVYFGALYLARGFGITAGAHACYDIVVLVLLPAQ